MSLTNPKDVVTEERLSEFYQGILPYLGGMPEILANKFSRSDIYSTEEKMIGVWTDGKPLYQKIVTTGGSVPSGATLIFRQAMTGYDAILYTKTADSPISIGSDTDYSTDEKIVGTDTDGKWVYQKTINCGALPNATEKTVAHGISNFGKLKKIWGTANYPSTVQICLPFVSEVSVSNNIRLRVNATNIIISTGHDYRVFEESSITIEYTKTS